MSEIPKVPGFEIPEGKNKYGMKLGEVIPTAYAEPIGKDTNTYSGSLPSKDETRLKPYLRICNVIEEKRTDIQELLVKRLDEVFLKQTELFNNPTKLYKTITDNTINVVISHIKSMFSDENSRKLGFQLAKDAYMKNNKDGAIKLFSAKDLTQYNQIRDEQLEASLEITRNKVNTPNNVNTQTGGAEQDRDLVDIFNKLYGNEAFQKKINKMITTKLGKIIDGPTVEKQLLTNVQSKLVELTKTINSQINKLITKLNEDAAMNLLMIKALGDTYIQEYFQNTKVSKNLEQFNQYIDKSILSPAQFAANRPKQGGKRKTKRRRQNKRRNRSSTKNIA